MLMPFFIICHTFCTILIRSERNHLFFHSENMYLIALLMSSPPRLSSSLLSEEPRICSDSTHKHTSGATTRLTNINMAD